MDIFLYILGLILAGVGVFNFQLSEEKAHGFLVVGVILLILGLIVSSSESEARTVSAAHQAIVAKYGVDVPDVAIGEPVCTSSDRYSCNGWKAEYTVSLDDGTVVTGIVEFDRNSQIIVENSP